MCRVTLSFTIVKYLSIFLIIVLALSLAPLTVAHAAGDFPPTSASDVADTALHPQPTGVLPELTLASVPIITATKTYTLSVDADGDNRADPGDTLRYTIIIANSGDTDASSAVFTDTIDDNTTFVPASLNTTPLARSDSYSTVGNVQLSVSAPGVLANDSDPDGTGGLTVSSFSPTSASGGQVSVAANGSFTYNPPPGFAGTDTFQYTVNDGEGNTNPATVSITVGPTVVWFINNTVGGPGDGRFTSPFNSIANFNTLAADDPGDIIFVYQGSGAYSGAFTLLNNQQLIGHGVGLTIAPNLSIAAASRPTIANVTLASGNTVRGLNVSTNTGTGISGGSVGTLTINNVSVTNSGGVGVSLSNGTLAVTFDSVSSSGGANGIFLSQNSGSFTVNGGTIDPTTGHGIQVSNTTAGPLNFTLQNSVVTNAAAGQNGVNLEVPPGGSGSFGTVTVQNNTISNNGSTGLRANIQGSGSIGLITITGNTFVNNDIGVDLATNGTASVDFNVSNNPTMSGDRTQVNIAANGAAGATMEGHIRNNTISLNPADVGIAVWVVSDGNSNITVNIANNNITGFGDSGIDVEARGGTGDVHARIANNTASTTSTGTGVLAAMFLRSGNGTVGETNNLCVNVSNNNMNVGPSTFAIADYYMDRFATPSTFQIQGLSPSPATPVQAEAFILTTDSGPLPTTAVATGGSTPYVNATCNTVSFAAAPYSGPLYADASTPAPAETMQPATSQAVSIPGMIMTGGYRGLASPFLAPITPVNLGTLNPGEVITLTFEVTINDPLPGGVSQVANQGAVSGSNFSTVLTNDPTTPAPNDPTVTPIDLPAVSIAAGTTPSEAGPITGTFTITLTNPAPAGGLTVNYNLSGSTASTPADYSLAAGPNITGLSASTFTIASGVNSATINIVPVDDLVDEVNETVQVTLTAGAGYAVGTSTATQTIIDDDSAGTTVAPLSLTISEPNTTAVFTIALTSQPLATVTVTLVSTDTTECTVPAQVSLTSATWTGVPVTVTAVDDVVTDGPQPCRVLTGLTTSADPVYNNTFDPADVNVTVNDDDGPGFLIAPTTGLTTTEAGGTASFTIRLNTAPTATVTIALTSSDTTEGVVSLGSVSFTALDWNIPQTVTITGVDDLDIDGDIVYTIQTGPATSSDPSYNGLDPADVSVLNLDNEIAPTPNLFIFLPVIVKDFIIAPDLVIDSLTASSSGVTLVIRNQGTAPVVDAFWVDVYFNPSVPPGINQPWQTIAGHGQVWGVTGTGLSQLTPGGTLTLTSGDAFYFPQYSSTPPLPVGANVYGFVDSADFSSSFGGVQESNEANNRFGPVLSTAAAGVPSTGQAAAPSPEGLPPR